MASIRSQPGAGDRRAPGSKVVGELGRRPVDHRVEQRRLRGVVVEDRLLADAELAGERVERGGLVALGAERLQRGVEDALVGLAGLERPGHRWRCGVERPRRHDRSTVLTGRSRRALGATSAMLDAHLPSGRQSAVIREALAGKRIAITGTHRLPRHRAASSGCCARCPTASSCCSSGPAGARPSTSGSQREILKNDAFDRLRAELGKDGFDEMTARRVHRRRRRRRHRRPRPRRRTAGPPLATCDIVIHSAATVSLRLAARRAPSRSTCSGPPASPTLLQRARRHAPPRRRVHLLRRRQPPRRGPRGARRREPVLRRRRLARARSTAPAGRAPTPRPRAARPSSSPSSASEARQRARRRRHARCSPPRPSSSASRWVTDRMVEAGRARAASLGWPDAYAYTKALGEQALTETKGDVPGQHRAPVDHRVRPAPSPARAGSAASAWPSRSSSPTPAAC